MATDARRKRRISILGCTGSIGRSALEVVRQYPERFQVVALAARSNGELLARQVEEFTPEVAALADEQAAADLAWKHPRTALTSGLAAVEDAARYPVDVVLCAIVGAAGLQPLLAAIDAGNRVAVANKEPFVMAGRIVMARARQKGVDVLPVDSEHSAIFQCMLGYPRSAVHCIHLTASGGPFYGKGRDTLAAITPEQAVRHPTWDMGAKISVDSATLMNKGLEIIEAMWLFDLREDQVDVIIHPQSVVHSMVEFTDGNILAHLGITDMKLPIQFALTYPERVESPMGRLDLKALRELNFAPPHLDDFPCLALARQAAVEGGTAPAILNAANEVAVAAFCARLIPFLSISDVVRMTRDQCLVTAGQDLAEIVAADQVARHAAEQCVAAISMR